MGRIVALFLILTALTATCIVAVPPARAADASDDSWITMAPMPTARGGLGVAVVNGKIFAIGGIAGGVNEMYDPATNTWTTKAPMPTARWLFGIAAYQNKIYCIGGMSGSVTGVNEVYDPQTNTWETKAPMPTPRGDLCANVINGKIYLCGGYLGGLSYGNITEVYDPATDSWTTKASMPYPVVMYASAVVDDKIYVIGGQAVKRGQNGNDLVMDLDTTEIYDPTADAWSFGNPAPTIVLGATAGATTGINAPKRIYVIGGTDSGSGAISQNLVYDPAADVWRTGASMSVNRADVGIGVVDDLLYVIGGYDNHVSPRPTPYSDNQRYTPFGYGTVPPVVSVVSPQYNETYASGNVSLAFTLNKPAQQVSYSLDGQQNVTVPGNTTLTGLSAGLHNVTVYATDTLGNTGTSETVIFTVAAEKEKPTQPLLAAALATVTIVIVSVILLVYFRKRKR